MRQKVRICAPASITPEQNGKKKSKSIVALLLNLFQQQNGQNRRNFFSYIKKTENSAWGSSRHFAFSSFIFSAQYRKHYVHKINKCPTWLQLWNDKEHIESGDKEKKRTEKKNTDFTQIQNQNWFMQNGRKDEEIQDKTAA